MGCGEGTQVGWRGKEGIRVCMERSLHNDTYKKSYMQRQREFSVGAYAALPTPPPPPPPVWQYLETFLLVLTGEGCATGITWVRGQRRYNTPCVQDSTIPLNTHPQRIIQIYPKMSLTGLSRGPVVRFPSTDCRGCRFNPWLGN